MLSLLLSPSVRGQGDIDYKQELAEALDTGFLDRYESVIRRFELEDKERGIRKGQFVFVGSSSFRNWHHMERDMQPLSVINRGFGGSTMPEAVYYFKRIVLPYAPQAIVLYEGDNDITASFLTPELTLQMFDLFVRMTERYLPDTPLFFVSVKPSPLRMKYFDKLLIINGKIRNYCGQNPNLHYIDITEEMYGPDGEPRKELFSRDLLHMNKEGYKLWTRIIKKVLMETI